MPNKASTSCRRGQSHSPALTGRVSLGQKAMPFQHLSLPSPMAPRAVQSVLHRQLELKGSLQQLAPHSRHTVLRPSTHMKALLPLALMERPCPLTPPQLQHLLEMPQGPQSEHGMPAGSRHSLSKPSLFKFIHAKPTCSQQQSRHQHRPSHLHGHPKGSRPQLQQTQLILVHTQPIGSQGQHNMLNLLHAQPEGSQLQKQLQHNPLSLMHTQPIDSQQQCQVQHMLHSPLPLKRGRLLSSCFTSMHATSCSMWRASCSHVLM